MNPSLLPIVDVVAKSFAVLLFAHGVLSLWRSASASQRSLVWLVTFAVLLLLPAAALFQPWWSLKVAESAPVAPQAMVNSAPTALPASPAQAQPAAPVPDSAAATSYAWTPTLLQSLALLWALGAVSVLVHRLIGSLRLRALASATRSCTHSRLQALLQSSAHGLHLRQSVDLRLGAEVSVPMTWGSFRPVLLLPEEAVRWSDQDLAAALRHELGHIKHRDALTRQFMTLVCALYWFQPVVWKAARRWRTAQEQASDDVVMRHGAQADAYAMQLLDAARRVQQHGLLRGPLLAMAQPSTLESRLTAVMDTGRSRQPVRRLAFVAGAFTALAAFALSATLQLQAATAPTDPKAASVCIDGFVVECFSPEAIKKVLALDIRNGLAPDGSPKSPRILGALLEIPGVKYFGSKRVYAQVGSEATLSLSSNGTPAGTERFDVSLTPSIEGDLVKLDVNPNYERHLQNLPANTLTYLRVNKGGKGLLARGGNPSTSPSPGQRTLVYLVTASVVKEAPEAAATTADTAPVSGTAMQRAEKIIIPTVQFSGASVKDAIEFLRVKSRASDPAGKGINIILTPDAASSTASLTLDLKDVPLSEALRYTAELCNLKLTADGDAIILQEAGPPAPATKSSPPVPTTTPASTSTKSSASAKAKTIIIPAIQFTSASVAEAVEFLRIRARETDPQNTGINIILSNPTNAQITLDLKDVPLDAALQYVAELANMKVVPGDHALLIQPK